MKLNRAQCPTAVELERGFWTADAELRAHAESCPRCGPEWTEMAALADQGRGIPLPPSSPQRREDLRTALLVGKEPAATEPRPSRFWQLVSPLAAAAAVAVTWWLWPSHEAPPAAVTVFAHEHAEYVRTGKAPDEIVRLVRGTLTIDLEALPPGERFRIITGDAEIAVASGALDVTAEADQLRAVRVMRGSVQVLAASGQKVLVSSGQTWTASAAIAESRAAPDAGVAPLVVGPAPTAPKAEPPAAPSPRVASRPRPRREEPAPTPAPIVVPPAPVEIPDAAVAPPARSAAQQAFDDGWRAIRAGSFDAAAAAFDRATFAGDPRIAEDALYWRAVALARGGHAVQAMRVFSSFLDAYPRAVQAGEASVMLGWLLLENGDPIGAERRFRSAAEHPSAKVRKSATDGLKRVRDERDGAR